MGSIGNSSNTVQVPSGSTLMQEAKSLKGEALSDAIDRADSLGSYYREDKRQKRSYVTEITQNWRDKPENGDEIDNNLDVLYIVRGISKYSEEAVRLARYWEDEMYKTRRR